MYPVKILTGLLLACCSATIAFAEQSAADRAGDLKLWRQKCNDPDFDLRTGYIENAIAIGDALVQRICIRKALESSSADLQNLGLRAIIAASPQITFDVEYPKWLAKAYKKAGNDERKRRRVDSNHQALDIPYIRNGLTYVIAEASVSSKISVWHPLAAKTEASEHYKGKTAIRGNRLRWAGAIDLGATRECNLDVRLKSGSKLIGKLSCGYRGEYNVSADLL